MTRMGALHTYYYQGKMWTYYKNQGSGKRDKITINLCALCWVRLGSKLFLGAGIEIETVAECTVVLYVYLFSCSQNTLWILQASVHKDSYSSPVARWPDCDSNLFALIFSALVKFPKNNKFSLSFM